MVKNTSKEISSTASQKSEPSSSEKELQKKYMQFQILRQQLGAMIQEKANMENKISELNMTIVAVKKLDEIKEGEEMWSTLGSGAFVRSNILDKNKTIVDIGLGIFAKKNLEDTKNILHDRLEEISRVFDELSSEIMNMEKQLGMLENDMQSLSAKINE